MCNINASYRRRTNSNFKFGQATFLMTSIAIKGEIMHEDSYFAVDRKQLSYLDSDALESSLE